MDTPLLGVNLGHVGFWPVERSGLTETVEAIVDGRYTVERRMALDVTVWENQKKVLQALSTRPRSKRATAKKWWKSSSRWIAARCPRSVATVWSWQPHGIHRLRIFRRRTGGLARGRGPAHGAAVGSRIVLRPLSDLCAGSRWP